ncbi:MAG: hypothetical protein F6K42_08020 [Leptolyngbya sp. SIO1D8]|nr:hypothetical protein [Leptolyngbya sp. SIO1D8]
MRLPKNQTLSETEIPPDFMQKIPMGMQEKITGGDGAYLKFSVDFPSILQKDNKGSMDKLSCTIVDFDGDVDNSNRLFDGWGAASHL